MLQNSNGKFNYSLLLHPTFHGSIIIGRTLCFLFHYAFFHVIQTELGIWLVINNERDDFAVFYGSSCWLSFKGPLINATFCADSGKPDIDIFDSSFHSVGK